MMIPAFSIHERDFVHVYPNKNVDGLLCRTLGMKVNSVMQIIIVHPTLVALPSLADHVILDYKGSNGETGHQGPPFLNNLASV